jgi:hypothetical protein
MSNQRPIQCRKLEVLLILSAVGAFAQGAVATQVREVDFATHEQHCCE